MLEVKGNYNTAKIFTDVVDQKSIEQVKLLCDQEFVKDSKIRMMPDIHAGAGCTIGTTMTITDRVVPNLVGVDIGCGMTVTKLLLKEEDVDFEKLDKVIREYIPSGFNIREAIHEYSRNVRLEELDCYSYVDINRAYKSLGTLGGGNHFVEIDKDDEGYLYLVIHSGSRHLGVDVAKYYQAWAVGLAKDRMVEERRALVSRLFSEGRECDIETELNKLRAANKVYSDELTYIIGDAFYHYLHDMEIVQEYAKWNRMAIADTIIEKMGWGWKRLDEFTTIHNYIDTGDLILRKGAVSAKKDEILLIPINMRDGSLICKGKGNPDWNYSAPHGAGRLFGRMAAKELFNVEEFKEQMNGIYTTSVSEDTLDECPMAYKSMESIVNNIGDTVDILDVIKPVYNFKAGEV